VLLCEKIKGLHLTNDHFREARNYTPHLQMQQGPHYTAKGVVIIEPEKSKPP